MYRLNSFQYVIIDTGYTSRVWNEPDSDGNAIINTDHSFIDAIHESLYEGTGLSEEKALSLIQPLFAYDNVWGSGLYKIKNSEEADKIINILEDVDEFSSGIMCFKCSPQYLHILQKHLLSCDSYCTVYDFDDIRMLSSQNESDPGIIILSYHAESG